MVIKVEGGVIVLVSHGLPIHCPHHKVPCQLGKRLTQVHVPSPAFGAPKEVSDLHTPGGTHEMDLLLGECGSGGDTSEVPPVGPIGGPYQDGGVVAQMVAYEELGPVGKDDVVLREALLGGPWGGHHHSRLAAEAEREDGAVALGEGMEGPVEGLLEKVEVAQYGD